MPRAARKQSATSLYHVVNRGAGKQIIFEDDADRAFFMQRLDLLLEEFHGTLYAWCLMDNHFHLLLNIGFAELSSFMHKLQTAYAGYFNRVHEGVGSLFGTRFKSEPVENEGYLLTVVRYIHMNPVKAHYPRGLGYTWSSYREYLGKPRYIDPAFVLGVFGSKKAFLAFHQQDDDDRCLDTDDFAEQPALSDERALAIANDTLEDTTLSEIKGLGRAKRDQAIVALKDHGLGIRQIQRLTGVSLGTISRACKTQEESR